MMTIEGCGTALILTLCICFKSALGWELETHLVVTSSSLPNWGPMTEDYLERYDTIYSGNAISDTKGKSEGSPSQSLLSSLSSSSSSGYTFDSSDAAIAISYLCDDGTDTAIWKGFVRLDGTVVPAPGCVSMTDIPDYPTTLLIDVNGDNLMDVVYLTYNTVNGTSYSSLVFVTNTGDDVFAAPTTECNWSVDLTLKDIILDLNGDNQNEIFLTKHDFLFWATPGNCTLNEIVFALDLIVLTGGLLPSSVLPTQQPALVVGMAGHAQYLISENGGFDWLTQDIAEFTYELTSAQIVDYDGDGVNDLIISEQVENYYVSDHLLYTFVDPAWNYIKRVSTETEFYVAAPFFDDSDSCDDIADENSWDDDGLWGSDTLAVTRSSGHETSPSAIFSTEGELLSFYQGFLSSTQKADLVFSVTWEYNGDTFGSPDSEFQIFWIENTRSTFGTEGQMVTFGIIGLIIGLIPLLLLIALKSTQYAPTQVEVLSSEESTEERPIHPTGWQLPWNFNIQLATYGVCFIAPIIASCVSCIMPWMYMLFLPLCGFMYLFVFLPISTAILLHDRNTAPTGCLSSGRGAIFLRSCMAFILFCSMGGFIGMYFFADGVLCGEEYWVEQCDSGSKIALAMLVIILTCSVLWMGRLFFEIHLIRTHKLVNYGLVLSERTEPAIPAEQREPKTTRRLVKVELADRIMLLTIMVGLTVAVITNSVGGAKNFCILGGYVVMFLVVYEISIYLALFFLTRVKPLLILRGLSVAGSACLILGTLAVNFFYGTMAIRMFDIANEGEPGLWAFGFASGFSLAVTAFVYDIHTIYMTRKAMQSGEGSHLSGSTQTTPATPETSYAHSL